MNKYFIKTATALLFCALTALQAEKASAFSVDWSWSFDQVNVFFPQGDFQTTVYATVVNSSLSTESLFVSGINLIDGSMGEVGGLLFDSKGGGVLTPTALTSEALTVLPGQSVTLPLFTLLATLDSPTIVGEEYFAAPYLYAASASQYDVWDKKLPLEPLHITITPVPEPAANMMMALGVLAVAFRVRKTRSQSKT
jgi:hypothetical protein